MPDSEFAAAAHQNKATPVPTAERVRQGLSARRIAATPDQEKRLVKTLERLEPAACTVMATTASAHAATDTPFSAVLVRLSHA
jgi:hypothetical protein